MPKQSTDQLLNSCREKQKCKHPPFSIGLCLWFPLCVSLYSLVICSISQCPSTPFSLSCLSFIQMCTILFFPLSSHCPGFLALFHVLLSLSSSPLSTVDKVNLKHSAHPMPQSPVHADIHECHNAPASTNSFKPAEIPLKRLHLQRLLLGLVLHGKHGPAVSQSHQPWASQLLKDQGEKEAAAASSMSPSPWAHELIWEDSGGYQEDGGEQDPKAQ